MSIYAIEHYTELKHVMVKPRMKSAQTVVLDEQAPAIIEQFQEDGRRPFTRVAKGVGLSEATVRQRVRQLKDAGVRATESFIYISLRTQTYTWGAH
jgi:hypothetical protein